MPKDVKEAKAKEGKGETKADTADKKKDESEKNNESGAKKAQAAPARAPNEGVQAVALALMALGAVGVALLSVAVGAIVDPSFGEMIADYIDIVAGNGQVVKARQLAVSEGLALSTGQINSQLSADMRKRTPLCMAAANSDDEGIRILLSAGANVNGRDKDNATPLFWAVRHDCVDCVRTLLDAGANPKHVDKLQNTVLLRSAVHGNSVVTEMLLKAGSDLEHRDKDGRTALMRAVTYGHKEVVRVLIAAGADAGAFDADTNMTALVYCARASYNEICEILIEEGKADVHKRDMYNNTAMVYAKDKGNIDLVNMIRKQIRREQGTGEFAPDYDPEQAEEEARQRKVAADTRRCGEEGFAYPCDGSEEDTNDYSWFEKRNGVGVRPMAKPDSV